jgi:hypothetical protein
MVTATVLYLPGVVYSVGGLRSTAAAVAWLGAAACGLVFGWNGAPRVSLTAARWLTWLASAAALFFFVGLLGAMALLVSLVANMPALTAPAGDDVTPFAYYLQGVAAPSIAALFLIAFVSGILLPRARRSIDVNLISRC